MSTFSYLSFSGGEVSPSLYARVDTVKYATGLRTARNGYIKKEGGFQSRPGTKFVAETEDSSEVTRLIPFVLSGTVAYVIEIGEDKIRFYANGAQVRDAAQSITAITKASPAVVTYSGSDNYANGDEVYISGVVGMTEVNNRSFKIGNVDTGNNTFELSYMDGTAVDSSAFTTYSSAGTVEAVYELASPYAVADLAGIRFAQSGSVITLAHSSYKVRQITYTSATSWAITSITGSSGFTVTDVDQGGDGLTTDKTPGGAGFVQDYKISNVSVDGEESLAGAQDGRSSITASSGTPCVLSWTAPTDTSVVAQRIYRKSGGGSSLNANPYYLIGEVTAFDATFTDNGKTEDLTQRSPAINENVLDYHTGSNFPLAVAYFQQRQWFGNFINDTEFVLGSRTGNYLNFLRYYPQSDADAVAFSLVGNKVSSIKHILPIRKLLLLTESGEILVKGNGDGVITPLDINIEVQTNNGISDVRPLIVRDTAIYLQGRGSIVRDLSFDYTGDGYSGNDLSIFSNHLFDGYTIVDWDYQQNPNSIVWAVRSDGALLSMTYVKEQQVLAWTKHDLGDGTAENICVIPEGTEDAVYLVVKRTVDGATKRYIERMASRSISDVVDNLFMDCTHTYDGRNTSAVTMTISTGTDYTYGETLTLTASSGTFASTDVDDEFHLTGSDGEIIRFKVYTYSSSTVVTGIANRDIPTSLQATAVTDWTHAVASVSGLWHIEGESVSVFADRYVVASPNNASYDAVTIADGVATLDDYYGVIHIGLPYIVDAETLDINSSQGETLSDKYKNITAVAAQFEKSRGLWVGAKPPTDDSTDPLEGLFELKVRDTEGYDDPVSLFTGVEEVHIESQWNNNGRVFFRQVDPVPLTILAAYPSGYIPSGGA